MVGSTPSTASPVPVFFDLPADVLSVEEWLVQGGARTNVENLASALREEGYDDTDAIYCGSWDDLCRDLDTNKLLKPVQLRMIKRAFDAGRPATSTVSASPSSPLAQIPSPMLHSPSVPLQVPLQVPTPSAASHTASTSLQPPIPPGASTYATQLLSPLQQFEQARLCLDQLLVHVAAPVFLRYFEDRWDAWMCSNALLVCNGCNTRHAFHLITPGCVLSVASSTKHELMKIFANKSPALARGKEVLRFDVGLLCFAFDALIGVSVRRNNQKIDLIVSHARNVQAHLLNGTGDELQSAVEWLIDTTEDLMVDLQYSEPETREVRRTIERCRIAKTYLQLEQFHFDDLSHRMSETQFQRFDLYNLSAQVRARYERTLQIAEVLSRKNVGKFLFLPPVLPAQLDAAREKYAVLDTITWKTVFDFSGVEGGFLPKSAGNLKTDYFLVADSGAAKVMSATRKAEMTQAFLVIFSSDGAEKVCFFAATRSPGVDESELSQGYSLKLNMLRDCLPLPSCKFFLLYEEDAIDSDTGHSETSVFDAVLNTLNSPLPTDKSAPVAKLSPLEQTRRCSLRLLEAELSKASGGITLLVPSGVIGAHRYPLSSKVWDEFLSYADGEILDFGCGSYPLDRKTGKPCAAETKKANLHAFLDGARAAWPLFADGSLKNRSQFDDVRRTLDEPQKQSVILCHTSKAGGTTLARHVLYSLHERYICIAVSSFKSTEDIERAIAVLKRIHWEVGNEIILLIDLDGDTFPESFRNDVRQQLRKVGAFCRFLECSTHAQHGSAHKVFNNDGEFMHIELEPLTGQEATEFMERYPAWFPDRADEISRCIEQSLNLDGFSLPAQYMNEGVFDSNLLLTTVGKKEGTSGWEDRLVKFAVDSPEALISGGFWPLEVFELSSQVASFHLSDKFRLTKLPLIHCGLLAASSKYAERARHAVKKIIQYLHVNNAFEFEFLKFLVFTSLFAPSIRFTTTFYKLFDPEDRPLSQSFMEMVRCETTTGASMMEVVSIPIPKMSMIIAEHEYMFRSSKVAQAKTRSSVSVNSKEGGGAGNKCTGSPTLEAKDFPVVGLYAKEVLIPLIKKCAESSAFAQLRQHLLYTLNYAFCSFNVWHWVLRNQPTQHDKSYAFIVEFLKKSNSLKFAAEVFRDVAIAAIALTDTQVKHNVGLLTHACRLLEENKSLPEASSLLAKVTNAFAGDAVVMLRRASIAKKQMQGLIQMFKAKPTELPVKTLLEIYEESLNLFKAAIEQSQSSWSHPINGMVQLTIALISALQAKFGCLGSIDNCRAGLHHSTAQGAKRLLHYVTNGEVAKMYNLLTGSRMASKYIVADTDLERGQAYLTECINKLEHLQGKPTPLQQAQHLLHTCTYRGFYTVRGMELEKLCWCLVVIGKDVGTVITQREVPMAHQNGADEVAADASSWAIKAEMENIVEMSTALAARVHTVSVGPAHCSGVLPQISYRHCNDVWDAQCSRVMKDVPRGVSEAEALSVLYHPDQALHRWLSYPATTAHGLGRFVANVMMRVYNKLFIPSNASADKSDALEIALSKLLEASRRFGNVHTTRYFVAKQCIIKDMPLTGFIAVDCNPDLLQARINRSKHSHYAKVFQAQGTVRIFQGVVQLPLHRSTTAQSGVNSRGGEDTEYSAAQHAYEEVSQHPRWVSCAELGLSMRFYNDRNLDGSPEFGEGEDVTYAVGIKDSGLYAHGLARA